MYIVECILKLAWGWLWGTNPQAVATGTGKILIKSGQKFQDGVGKGDDVMGKDGCLKVLIIL